MRFRTLLFVLSIATAMIVASTASTSTKYEGKWWVGHSLTYRLHAQLVIRRDARQTLRTIEANPQLWRLERRATARAEREARRRLYVLRYEIPDTREGLAAERAAAAAAAAATPTYLVSTSSGGSCSYGPSTNPYVSPCGCESSTDQVVSPNGTYWGKYQFDLSTWIANGGTAASYGSASAAEQDAVAANVSYDAWPNC